MESTWADFLMDSRYRHAGGRVIRRPSPDGMSMLVELRSPRGPIRVLVAVYDGDDDPRYLPRWLNDLVDDYVGGWEEFRRLGISRIDVWLPHGIYEIFVREAPEEVRGVPISLQDLQDLRLPLESVEGASRSFIRAVGEISVPREEDKVKGVEEPSPPRAVEREASRPADLELLQESGKLVDLLEELLKELRRRGRTEESEEKLSALEESLRRLADEIRELKSGSTLESLRLAALEKRVDELSRSIEMLLTIVRLLSSGASIAPTPMEIHPKPDVAPPRTKFEAPVERREATPTETVKDLRVEAQPEKPPGEGVSLDLLEEFARDNPWADVLSKKGVKGDEG